MRLKNILHIMTDKKEIKEKVQITEQYLNITEVIRSKNPGLVKLLPNFVLNYLKRIIHEKDLNSAIFRNRDLFGVNFVDAIIKEFGAIIKVTNPENIHKTGRYIIASNHSLGGLDGLTLMNVIGKVRKDIVFPVNDILMFLPNLNELFIPINKHGKNTENINIIDKTFESDTLILFFPAGLVSRKQKHGIMDLEWKKTFISKAVKYKRDIIPVYIDGKNSNFFYNLANLRKKLGIKANIEMLYLVNEMYKQKNKTINIIIGKPISYKTFDKSLRFNEWAQKIRKYVYSLSKNKNLTFETK